jgi:hypothetical protein
VNGRCHMTKREIRSPQNTPTHWFHHSPLIVFRAG